MKRLLLLVPLSVALVFAGSAAGILPRVSAADPGACEPTDVRCLTRETDRLAADLGARGALERLRLLADENIELDYRCHGLAHRIGLATMEREGGAARALLAAGPELRSCSDGYIHGVMLGALDSLPGGEVAAAAAAICADPEILSAIGGVLANCLHGAGHGIVTASDGELGLAVERCAAAFSGEPFASDYGPTRCASGAFMEALIPTLTDAAVEGPLERCDALASDPAIADVLWLCYLNAADAASRESVVRPDPALVERCAAVTPPYTESCISGALSHPSAETSAATLASFCAVLGDAGIPGSAAEHCLEGLTADLSIHRPEDPRAVELCAIAADLSHLATPRDARLVGCVRDYLVGVIDYWGDEGIVERVCGLLVEPALVAACRTPLPVPGASPAS